MSGLATPRAGAGKLSENNSGSLDVTDDLPDTRSFPREDTRLAGFPGLLLLGSMASH